MHVMLAKLDAGEDLAVAIIDTRDEVGKLLAEHMRVVEEVERIAGSNRIPTIIGAVERRDAANAFGETHPKVSVGLSVRPPPSHVPVIVIASGGITLAYVERIAIPMIGEA